MRARDLDCMDPLAVFRPRFVVDESNLIYMDGNSLGRMPRKTAELLGDFEKSWGRDLIAGWNNGWYTLSERLGAKIASLIGAKANEVIVCDSTSINLFKLAHAALSVQRPNGRKTIVSNLTNFPSDLYVLQGLGEVRTFESLDEQTSLVSLSHVEFKSGALLDMASETKRAHNHGALMLWDLSHSVGAIPINLNDCQVDLAVGCTYKYLNGGPGAPAFIYIREDLQDQMMSPIQGWFGQHDPFSFSQHYQPAGGLRRFLAGTPPVISLTAIEPGIDLILEAGIDRLREKSLAQTAFLIEIYDEFLAPLGVELHTPRSPNDRGSHVSLGHANAWQITQALIENRRVIPDFRTPDSVRFGVTPIYTTFEEIARAMISLHDVVATNEFMSFSNARHAVT